MSHSGGFKLCGDLINFLGSCIDPNIYEDLKGATRVTTCFTMQAVLQISAGVLYPAPISTSSERYCRVWMSSVKCLCCRGRTNKAQRAHVPLFKIGQRFFKKK